jgi:pilus assembly protein CpaE
VAEDRSVVIIEPDEKTRQRLVKIAQSLPGVSVAAETAELNLGLKLARQTRPGLLVVPAEDDESLVAIERFHADFPGTAIMASSSTDGTEIVLKCVRAGAKEYVPRPIDEDEARRAIDRLLRQLTAQKTGISRTIAVFSNKGGTGASTVAVNLAVALSRVTGKDVALADFDRNAGEVALHLNVRPTKTLAHLATVPGKLDGTTVQSALVKHDTGVFVLCEPERLEQTENVTPARVREILEHLANSFAYVVCDLTHSFDDVSLEVFDASSTILVVTLLNLPAIRSAHRCINVFRQLNYLRDEHKVRLIVNRYVPNRDIDVEQLEETLQHPVFWRIPNDYQTVIDAVNSGMPIDEVSPESEVAQSFRRLAASLAGLSTAPERAESGGLFARLLGRR